MVARHPEGTRALFSAIVVLGEPAFGSLHPHLDSQFVVASRKQVGVVGGDAVEANNQTGVDCNTSRKARR